MSQHVYTFTLLDVKMSSTVLILEFTRFHVGTTYFHVGMMLRGKHVRNTCFLGGNKFVPIIGVWIIGVVLYISRVEQCQICSQIAKGQTCKGWMSKDTL